MALNLISANINDDAILKGAARESFGARKGSFTSAWKKMRCIPVQADH